MRRTVAWGVGVGLLGGLGVFLARVGSREAPIAVAETAGKPAAAPSAPEEKVVYTFQNDTSMQAFVQLWQQREATLTRMAVLQAYWNEEQKGVDRLNQQLVKEFNLDITKSHKLDTDHKVLIELPAQPPAPADAATPQVQTQAQPATSTPQSTPSLPSSKGGAPDRVKSLGR